MLRARLLLVFASSVTSVLCAAMEDAKVLPKGVRRLAVTTIHTGFNSQNDSQGNEKSAGAALEKTVSYSDFINQRNGVDKAQLKALLLANGTDENTVVGQFEADVEGQVNVFAPSFSYGLSDRWSVGFAIPIYQARTDAAVSFHANEEADRFVAGLAATGSGLASKVNEAVHTLNNVSEMLNQKLEANGYERLGEWEQTGLGDVLVKGRYQGLKTSRQRGVAEVGFVAPTGRTDDPDVLTDVAFGDGSWDLIIGGIYDYSFAGTPLFVNGYSRYTAQLPAERTVRMKTADEPIVSETKDVRYDLGDKFDAGASLQLDAQSGLNAGLGYNYYFKGEDKYYAGTSSKSYEQGTTQLQHSGELSLGYSSVNAYYRGRSLVPYTGSLSYQKQYHALNLPNADRVQFDFKLYF